MIINIEFDKKLPAATIKKAHEVLHKVAAKEIHPKKIHAHGALSVEIGRDYRAIKFTDRDYWFVCSHERYNRFITRGR